MWIQRNASLIRGVKVWQTRLQIETPTGGCDPMQHTADTSCNAKQNLNQQLWPGVTFLCNSWFLDLLTQILSATSQSSNKIYIYKSSWDLWLSVAKNPVKLCWVSGEMCMICLRFCISLAMIVQGPRYPSAHRHVTSLEIGALVICSWAVEGQCIFVDRELLK